jgi:hypothetical protein
VAAPASVCIKCGALKVRALAKCARCAFAPSTPDEQAIGRSPDELTRIAKSLQSGETYAFDAKEVEAVKALNTSARAITPGGLIIDLVRWVGPALVALVVVFWLLSRK